MISPAFTPAARYWAALNVLRIFTRATTRTQRMCKRPITLSPDLERAHA